MGCIGRQECVVGVAASDQRARQVARPLPTTENRGSVSFVRVGRLAGLRRSRRVSRDTTRGASSDRIGLDGTSTKTESRILKYSSISGDCAFSVDTNDLHLSWLNSQRQLPNRVPRGMLCLRSDPVRSWSVSAGFSSSNQLVGTTSTSTC